METEGWFKNTGPNVSGNIDVISGNYKRNIFEMMQPTEIVHGFARFGRCFNDLVDE